MAGEAPARRATYRDEVGYGEDPIPDVEDYVMRHQASWTNGHTDSVDWASPGKQY